MNGTLVNYYFHCKRQCYLHGNRINLEDNSEDVKIGKAMHEEKALKYNKTEVSIDNIKIDRITKDYLTEIKKSDADVTAVKWQTIYYLYILKQKGIYVKGRVEYIEKNKKDKKSVEIYELTEDIEKELLEYVEKIEKLIEQDEVPPLEDKHCKNCAYYEYCYI